MKVPVNKISNKNEELRRKLIEVLKNEILHKIKNFNCVEELEKFQFNVFKSVVFRNLRYCRLCLLLGSSDLTLNCFTRSLLIS